MSAALDPPRRSVGRRVLAPAAGLAAILVLRAVGLLNLSFFLEAGVQRVASLIGEVALPLALLVAIVVSVQRSGGAGAGRAPAALGAGLLAFAGVALVLRWAGLFDTDGIHLAEEVVRLVPQVLLPLVVSGAAFVLADRLVRDGSPRGGAERSASASVGREAVAVAVGAVLLAVITRWPVILHMRTNVPFELDDPILQAWHLAWGGHALLTQPLDPFQANTHWPERNSLAFSDGMIGYAPFGLLIGGARSALVEYNALFLGSFALAFGAVYGLARQLHTGAAGAAAAGAAFAYAPWRIAQGNHLNVISSGGIALALFLLVWGYRRRRPGVVLGGWLAAVWQLSLGFALGLQFAYLLGALAAVVIAIWLLRGRPRLGRAVVVATLLGAGAFVVAGALLAGPYLDVAAAHPEGRRTLEQVAELSPPPRGFLATSGGSLVWGEPTKAVRETLAAPGEQSLFPGASIALLALAGAIVGTYGRGLRFGLVLGVGLCALLSLGLSLGGGTLTYRPLYELAPGWQGVRTPGRLMTLTSLGLALLAGAGVGWLARRAGGRERSVLIAVMAVGVILLEGWGPGGPGQVVPAAPPGQIGAPAPQLHLPITGRANHLYTFWSIAGFPDIVNGGGSPPAHPLEPLKGQASLEFPSRVTVAGLRRAGVRSVILHPGLAPGSQAERIGRRSIRGLGITRRSGGGVVVFDLRPGEGTS